MFDLQIDAMCAEAGIRAEDERAARMVDKKGVTPVVVVG